MNFIHINNILNVIIIHVATIFLRSSLSTCFHIMNPLKFSITSSLNTCSVRWRQGPRESYFFYIESLVKEDMGGIHRTLLSKVLWNSQVARKWVKDICPHLIMFWLCLVTCEYVQLTHIHTFTHKEVIFTLSWSNRKSHLWEVNLFELFQSLCWSWLSCFGVLWWNFWVHLSIKSNYQQIVIVWVVPFQFVSLWPHFFLIGRARTSSTIFNR